MALLFEFAQKCTFGEFFKFVYGLYMRHLLIHMVLNEYILASAGDVTMCVWLWLASRSQNAVVGTNPVNDIALKLKKIK